ncbi:hypothetical protein FOZ63_024226, partial [Perkinsus olseni]
MRNTTSATSNSRELFGFHRESPQSLLESAVNPFDLAVGFKCRMTKAMKSVPLSVRTYAGKPNLKIQLLEMTVATSALSCLNGAEHH